MPLFDYIGLDGQGKKVSGVIEAPGKNAVLLKLRSQGLFPTQVHEVSAAPAKTSWLKFRFPQRITEVELAAATRQLATLLGAGLPLDETLATVAAQLERARFARALDGIREQVIQGETLHAALAQHPRIFPSLYVNMVQVGESSGTLDRVLQQLADFLEAQARTKSKIQAAMAYPLLMALIGSGVMLFLFTFVVPKITRMLEDLGQDLPVPTRMLISGSDFLNQWWWVLLLLLIVAGVMLRRYNGTQRGRLALDRLTLRIPLFGKLHLLVITARLTRTLGTLLHNGVPLLNSLAISLNLISNQVLRQALEDTVTAVREGEGLAAPLKRSGVFPPMVSQMAAVGERSGQLEEMLLRVAEAYEHQVELAITGLLSLLEPLMILLMGGAVGFIVMAILLPIFQASQGMG